MEASPSSQSQLGFSPTTSTNSRKRPRENETPSQRHKREKAAERQRRKRERDRNASNAINNIAPFVHSPEAIDQQQQQQQHQTPQHQPPPETTAHDFTPSFAGQDLTPGEIARRDRVRAAARDRQRKHRQLVKAKKMRELGLDMGNDVMPGMEGVYRVNADGQYQVMPHELQQQALAHEPPFPHGQALGGQTFASTLLLSFSCAPLLKQHLLRTLSMSNEELASLEPIIAEAWDHWDHQRRMHFAEQAANVAKAAAGPNMNGPSGPAFPVEMGDPSAFSSDPSQQPNANDFRARFHRPLVAPSPFRNFATDTQNTTPPSSTAGSGAPSSDPIDPHLTSAVSGNGTANDSRSQPSSGLDPELGQARGEAEGVVGRLERG